MTTMNNEDPADPSVHEPRELPEPAAWAQPDHLQKARLAPFMCRVEPTQRHADFVPIYTADQMREVIAAERERSDELAALRILVRELRGRLERVKSEPQDTMSDSKAVSAMVRHAKLGLQAIERLDRAAEKEQPQ